MRFVGVNEGPRLASLRTVTAEIFKAEIFNMLPVWMRVCCKRSNSLVASIALPDLLQCFNNFRAQ